MRVGATGREQVVNICERTGKDLVSFRKESFAPVQRHTLGHGGFPYDLVEVVLLKGFCPVLRLGVRHHRVGQPLFCRIRRHEPTAPQ
eukprot:SAG31_NODE_2214_length_6174_cov_3.902551_2_plen_87_part_00